MRFFDCSRNPAGCTFQGPVSGDVCPNCGAEHPDDR